MEKLGMDLQNTRNAGEIEKGNQLNRSVKDEVMDEGQCGWDRPSGEAEQELTHEEREGMRSNQERACPLALSGTVSSPGRGVGLKMHS